MLKSCGICDLTFPHDVDVLEIASHYASCVHSFSEKHNVNVCLCDSCSPRRKAIGQACRYLDKSTVANVATLSRRVFQQLKPQIEARFWFLMSDGGFTTYSPQRLKVVHKRHLNELPKATKQVWFSPHSDEYMHPIDHLPEIVTVISLGFGFDIDVLHWPASLESLDLITFNAKSISTLPATLSYLKIRSNNTLAKEVPALPIGLKELDVFGSFAFSSFPPSLEKCIITTPKTHQWAIMAVEDPTLPVLPASLKVLVLGDKYDEPIALPPNLIHFSTGNDFNQPFSSSSFPSSLQILRLGNNYTCRLPQISASGITKLTTGDKFNRQFDDLPGSLRSLTLGVAYDQKLPVLPAGLKKLKTGKYFNQVLDTLPESLQTLQLGDTFNNPLPALPENLEKLIIGHKFNQVIPALPASLKLLDIGDRFAQALPDLPSKLESLHVGNQAFPLPSSFPVSLQHLAACNTAFRLPLSLPAALKTINIVWTEPVYGPLAIPSSVEKVCIQQGSYQFILELHNK